MNIRPIQNITLCGAEEKPKKGKRFYRNLTGIVLGTGVCCLASDRLLKNPKKLPTETSKFGFWMSWAGLAMVALGIAKAIYDHLMKAYEEE